MKTLRDIGTEIYQENDEELIWEMNIDNDIHPILLSKEDVEKLISKFQYELEAMEDKTNYYDDNYEDEDLSLPEGTDDLDALLGDIGDVEELDFE